MGSACMNLRSVREGPAHKYMLGTTPDWSAVTGDEAKAASRIRSVMRPASTAFIDTSRV
jgi:hypothetical protein